MTSSANDDLLRRLLTGELDVEDPQVREVAARDPQFARAASEAREVQAQLDAAARVRALDLARAAGSGDEATDSRVRDFVLSRVDERRRLRWRRRAIVLACVAAASFLAFLGPWWGRRVPDRDPTLGSQEIVLVEPVGEGADFGRFRWTADVTTGWFVVRVLDPEGQTLEESDPLDLEGVWEPDAADVAAWPSRIWWEVRWFDASGSGQEPRGTWASR